jgi:hypothetical protein
MKPSLSSVLASALFAVSAHGAVLQFSALDYDVHRGERITAVDWSDIAVNLEAGSTSAPGHSPGSQITGSQTWNGGAAYEWEINKVDGTAGASPGWDLIAINGGLQINATPEDPFTLKIISLALDNQPGPAQNFNAQISASWKILGATFGVNDFNPNAIHIDASQFQNTLNGTFSVSLENLDRDLILNYVTNVPEPAACAAMAATTLLAFAIARSQTKRPAQLRRPNTLS